jgi:hypothetical protein
MLNRGCQLRLRPSERVTLLARVASALVVAAAAACGPSDPPENPGWADVEPIMRGACSGCHGSSAQTTGNGFRFDFYDMTADPCGEAAGVLAGVSLARAQADHIARAITTTDPGVRPSMPPVPAPYLADNEWLTLLRWTANPIKGDKPPQNRAPQISIEGTSLTADQVLDVNVVVHDPDGDPVVGIVKIGDQVGKIDRAGAFSARWDTSSWPAGAVTMSAVLCDGWSQVSADLQQISIHH